MAEDIPIENSKLICQLEDGTDPIIIKVSKSGSQPSTTFAKEKKAAKREIKKATATFYEKVHRTSPELSYKLAL